MFWNWMPLDSFRVSRPLKSLMDIKMRSSGMANSEDPDQTAPSFRSSLI